MSEYKDFAIDFVKRTKVNLDNYSGKFETTNLINNCLGLIIIPKQKLQEKIPDYIFNEQDSKYGISKNNISLEEKKDYSLSNILRHIRNGLAHGRIEQKTEKGTIVGLRLYDKFNDKNPENFSIEFSIKEFEEFAIRVSNELSK